MAHTNSTPNYSLPQFIPTDKPAWLTDINGAFSNIDTAIGTAQTKADEAYGNAGTAQGDATSALANAAAAGYLYEPTQDEIRQMLRNLRNLKWQE